MVEEGGVTATEIAGRGVGGGAPGVTGGGSALGEVEWALEFGTEAQPPARRATSKRHTTTATGARVTARTPGSEFKVPILQNVCS